jgi:hypothetical protein
MKQYLTIVAGILTAVVIIGIAFEINSAYQRHQVYRAQIKAHYADEPVSA